ncbi:MAG: hypothetical protein H6874_01445 [Hyphomicrobiaceae bacterium]|nr:hypothetical protein [Hyphomicrobiaceae bacterium]
MYTVAAILALIALVVFVIGVIGVLFAKGKRRRSALICLGGIGLFLVSGVLGAVFRPDPSPTVNEAIAEAASPVEAENTDELQTLPTEEPAPQSQAVEDQVAIEQARLLARPEALEAYCAGMDQYVTLYERADEKFGLDFSDEKTAWIRQTDAEETAQMTEVIGLPASVWSSRATEDHWDQRCRALEQGWPAITFEEIYGADADDRRAVRNALETFYTSQINLGRLSDALSNPYNSINCRDDEVDGIPLIGCRLEGRASRTPFYLFFAARADERLFAVPYDQELVDHFQTANAIPGSGSLRIQLGWFIDYPTPVPYPVLKSTFN